MKTLREQSIAGEIPVHLLELPLIARQRHFSSEISLLSNHSLLNKTPLTYYMRTLNATSPTYYMRTADYLMKLWLPAQLQPS